MSEHRLPAVRTAPLSADQIAEKMASGHSVFSPSAAEMTMTCAESLVLNTLAEDVQTYEAAEGTVGHEIGEQWNKTGVRPDDRVGEIVTIGDHDIEITEEMIEFVGDYVEECDRTRAEYEECFTEQQVDHSSLTPIPHQAGTLDFAGIKDRKAKLIDLKYGKEPVFAFYPEDGTMNKQLAVYAIALMDEWDWLYHFEEFEFVICQPRLPHVFSRHTVTRAELLEFAEFAREKWALSWTIQPGRTPSIKGCRWCKVRATCPALYLFMVDDTADVFENWDDDDDVIDVKPHAVSYKDMKKANKRILDKFEPSPFPDLPEPATLSTRAMEKLLRYRKLMDTFFNAIQQELLTRSISNEEELKWWKLVQSRTRRTWVDDEEFIVERLVAEGLSEADLYETKMLSPAGMERLLHTKLKMSLSKAKAFIQEHGLAVQPPGQKTLALNSDNRRALPKDSDVFINWDEDDDNS